MEVYFILANIVLLSIVLIYKICTEVDLVYFESTVHSFVDNVLSILFDVLTINPLFFLIILIYNRLVVVV